MAAEETTLLQRVTLLTDALAAMYPARRVSRSLVEYDNRTPEELAAGIYTIVSLGERGYKNYNDREAMDGNHRILLVGQIKLDELGPLEEAGELVENAEFEMAEEIKAFLRAPAPARPAELCCLVATGFSQSGQMDTPYGAVAFDLECTND